MIRKNTKQSVQPNGLRSLLKIERNESTLAKTFEDNLKKKLKDYIHPDFKSKDEESKSESLSNESITDNPIVPMKLFKKKRKRSLNRGQTSFEAI